MLSAFSEGKRSSIYWRICIELEEDIKAQSAEVKIDTFNFTKYGLIDGTLTTVSNDAVPDEQLGLRYLANVQIEKDWMQVENRKVSLAPGMSVAVEIKTGQRRLIEYFLSPLLRFKQESVRER